MVGLQGGDTSGGWGIEGLDLRALIGSYRGSGSASYHPEMLLGVLVYGYATGVFSSRKLGRATYDWVAFRFIAANDHPDHDTIATFRQPLVHRWRQQNPVWRKLLIPLTAPGIPSLSILPNYAPSPT